MSENLPGRDHYDAPDEDPRIWKRAQALAESSPWAITFWLAEHATEPEGMALHLPTIERRLQRGESLTIGELLVVLVSGASPILARQQLLERVRTDRDWIAQVESFVPEARAALAYDAADA